MHAKGVILESHGLFTWGDTAEGMLTRPRYRDHQPGDGLVRDREQRGQGDLRRRGGEACSACRWSAAPSRQKLMPRSYAGMISARRAASSAISTTRQAVLEFVNVEETSRKLAAARHLLPRPLSCAPRSGPLVIEFDPAQSGYRCGDRKAGPEAAIAAYRADYAGLLRRAASVPIQPC
jgi:rhamnose utilization protein RhaD (predicted bifunctional aldolase and dehydrogenase)